jgi:hypothetical protein
MIVSAVLLDQKKALTISPHPSDRKRNKKTISHTQTGAIQVIGPFLYNITTANESNERLFIVNCLMKRKKKKKSGREFHFSISQEK